MTDPVRFAGTRGTFDSFFSGADPAVTGVSIRIAPDLGTIVQSKLIDATPATATLADAPFVPGQTLVDPVSGATITTQSVSSTGATVSIRLSAATRRHRRRRGR